jgi:NSS family neurotransmitter:Na+ symporter
MTYILPILVLVIYFKGYYDMFKDRVWWQMCLWMGLAVLLAGFVVLLSLYGSKKVRANLERD